ncbi:MAG: transcriptional regulator [Eubacteriales bacterium]|nr:transcriptional regulator [Eubacteriales bacterium]
MEDLRAKVVEAFKTAGKPVSASDIVKLTGLDKKAVDGVFKQLKKEEAIVSPVRCKWELADK